jgi:hypothetical protein
MSTSNVAEPTWTHPMRLRMNRLMGTACQDAGEPQDQAGVGDDRAHAVAQGQAGIAHEGRHHRNDSFGGGGAQRDDGGADDDLGQPGAPGQVAPRPSIIQSAPLESTAMHAMMIASSSQPGSPAKAPCRAFSSTSRCERGNAIMRILDDPDAFQERSVSV